ncbi:MAG TPA: glycoside hydrolase family 2 protein, partial [Ktedonobacteraceae bacterium]|nr:glycoside hydrolase family 2 protein [Ktedonobacteraceae bacterium]
SYQTYETALRTAQSAGVNMLRVGGTMVYEDDAFYDLCDELGILIWQDFMFANMDYPTTNEDFLANCRQECEQLLARLQTHACLAVLCGNSEIQQQVAMLGLPQEAWKSTFFDHTLPTICQQYVDVPYWVSSPAGGALPFQANVGTSHYQGVGAFLRPLEDARCSDVRFAAECLSFAHIPEDQTIDLFIKPHELAVHHPKWKARVPRDAGAAWDFDDVRDYYLKLLFDVEPLKLRYSDMERYLALSRVTSGEVMAYVFAEWRRRNSVCNGGLTWFYRDLWPGAGWSMLDSTSYPKAAYYYFRRVSLPQACFFSDEGLNGLWLHVINDRETILSAEIQLSLYRAAGTCMASVSKTIALPPHDAVELHADALFEQFLDLTYAYRFGPAGYDVAVATMRNHQSSQPISEAFYFPQGLPSARETDLGLSAHAIAQADGTYMLTLQTEKFVQSVAIHVANYVPEDNYFHLQPHSEKVVTLFPVDKQRMITFRGVVAPLNAYNEITIQV